jgi:hypothetical protein
MPYEQGTNLYNPIPYAFFFSTRRPLFNGRYTMVGRSAGANVNFIKGPRYSPSRTLSCRSPRPVSAGPLGDHPYHQPYPLPQISTMWACPYAPPSRNNTNDRSLAFVAELQNQDSADLDSCYSAPCMASKSSRCHSCVLTSSPCCGRMLFTSASYLCGIRQHDWR